MRNNAHSNAKMRIQISNYRSLQFCFLRQFCWACVWHQEMHEQNYLIESPHLNFKWASTDAFELNFFHRNIHPRTEDAYVCVCIWRKSILLN